MVILKDWSTFKFLQNIFLLKCVQINPHINVPKEFSTDFGGEKSLKDIKFG